LHDAHEALTGDIPTTLKASEQRAVQHLLDERIARDLFPGGADAFARESAKIKEYDRRALLAEAFVVGPPRLSR
jgi:5'-deoxynucleotidase YfbR-like HD superfamily hydrolase